MGSRCCICAIEAEAGRSDLATNEAIIAAFMLGFGFGHDATAVAKATCVFHQIRLAEVARLARERRSAT